MYGDNLYISLLLQLFVFKIVLYFRCDARCRSLIFFDDVFPMLCVTLMPSPRAWVNPRPWGNMNLPHIGIRVAVTGNIALRRIRRYGPVLTQRTKL